MSEEETTTVVEVPKETKIVSHDDSAHANLLDTAKFEHLWRVASTFARSDLVPQHFRGKTENVFVVAQMAVRLNIDLMMMLQNTYVVHGQPGFQAKLAIALVNSSNQFDDPLFFDVKGSHEKGTLKCRAWTRRKGERIDGPWVTWKMVEGEGWNKDKEIKKNGKVVAILKSKWNTMPDLMMRYRAASFFVNTVCPERKMGMKTIDEIEDIQTMEEDAEVVEIHEENGKSRTEQMVEQANKNKSTDIASRFSTPTAAPHSSLIEETTEAEEHVEQQPAEESSKQTTEKSTESEEEVEKGSDILTELKARIGELGIEFAERKKKGDYNEIYSRHTSKMLQDLGDVDTAQAIIDDMETFLK